MREKNRFANVRLGAVSSVNGPVDTILCISSTFFVFEVVEY
jgi:hypothetical protein